MCLRGALIVRYRECGRGVRVIVEAATTSYTSA